MDPLDLGMGSRISQWITKAFCRGYRMSPQPLGPDQEREAEIMKGVRSSQELILSMLLLRDVQKIIFSLTRASWDRQYRDEA